jgi:hypothetical protein
MGPIQRHYKTLGSRRSDLFIAALAMAFLIVLVMLYFPAIVYAANAPFITYSLLDFLTVALPTALGLSLVALLVLALLPGSALRILAPPLAFLAFGAWVMGAFVTPLTTDIGLIDGTQRELVARPGLAVAELLIAGTLLAGFWWLFERLRHAVRNLLVVANVLALVYVGMVAADDRRSDTTDGAEGAFSVEDFMRFSEEENILIVLMDEFQSDFLVALLEEDPSLAEKLDGFTFFRDTAAVSPTTYLAMPSMYTGRYVDLSVSIRDAYELARSSSFLSETAKAGAATHLINPVGACPEGVICSPSDPIVFSGLEGVAQEWLLLMDLASFRMLPYLAKPFIFNDGQWRMSLLSPLNVPFSDFMVIRDNRVLPAIATQLYVETNQPTVKFIHLMNTHRPYIFDEECRVISARNDSFASALNAARCGVNGFVALLDRLRVEKIYDQTFIVLVADHGAGFPVGGSHGSNAIHVNEARQFRTVDHDNFRSPFGRAHPVFAVKPLHSRGALVENTTQAVSLVDLPATICKLTELCTTKGQGVPAFEAPVAEVRERRYMDYIWRHEFWQRDTFEDIVELHVIDFPMFMGPPAEEAVSRLGFSRSMLPVQGFSHAEPWGRWTDGPEARIPLRFDEALDEDLELVAELQPFIREAHPRQRVEVRLNGEPVAQWVFTHPEDAGPRELRAPLPRRLIADDGTALVTFHFPDATVSPADLGESEDGRLLGLGFRTLRLEPAGERIN